MSRTIPFIQDTRTKTRSGKSPSVSDVACLAGVSNTVIYTFIKGNYYTGAKGQSGRVGISERTRQRIVQAMDSLGYQPPDAASRVRVRRRAGGFLMMLSDSVQDGVGNPYFGRIFQGFSAAGAHDGRTVSLAGFEQKTDYVAHPEKLPEAVRSGLINKVLLAGDPNYSLIFALKKAACSVVYASRDLGCPDIPGVVPDYRQAARLAVEHLVSLGHRHIALAAGLHVHPDATFFKELTSGCAETWQQLSLPDPAPRFVFPDPAHPEPDNYLQAIRQAVPGVTAIFCFDDFAAINLITAALNSGCAVPKQLSIMGCNDEARPLIQIPLSTIRIPKMRIGETAARLLDEYNERGPAHPPKSCVLPVELKIRNTTGSAPDS